MAQQPKISEAKRQNTLDGLVDKLSHKDAEAIKHLNSYPSLKGKGTNSSHGQLNILEPSLANLVTGFKKEKVSPLFQSEPVFSKTPRFKLNQQESEQRAFDGLATIDLLLELINIAILVKLEGTEFDNFEAKMELSNIKSIVDELREKWVRKRIKFKSDLAGDFTFNEHAAEVYTLFDNLAFKPTDFVVGLNFIFEYYFKGGTTKSDLIQK